MSHKLTRVRHQYDANRLGWHNSKDGAIHDDADSTMRLMAYYRHNLKADQEDFGVPPEGYYTAYGYWFPVEE